MFSKGALGGFASFGRWLGFGGVAWRLVRLRPARVNLRGVGFGGAAHAASRGRAVVGLGVGGIVWHFRVVAVFACVHGLAP